jgi:hypothetical protein
MVATLLVGIAGPLAAEPAPAEAAKTAIRRLDLQTQLPSEAPASPRFRLNEDLVRILLWLSVIVGVGLLIYSLRDMIPMLDRSRWIKADDDKLSSQAPGDAMNEARMVAEDLARSGRFVEAMHVLLLQSLAELRKRLDINFADSLTSREILRRVSISDVGRTSFAIIVREVERTYFGGQSAEMDDYVVCREHFELLKESLVSAPST